MILWIQYRLPNSYPASGKRGSSHWRRSGTSRLAVFQTSSRFYNVVGVDEFVSHARH